MTSRIGTAYALSLLLAINVMNFFDRQIFGAVAEPLRKEWGLSDAAVGAIGTAFTLLYAAVGVPIGRLADRSARTKILAAGVFVWSLLTAASGLARNFWQLVVLRLGIGVGTATCAPAATSLVGDLFPATRRAWALSIFMLGLPAGVALSYAVSGWIAHSHGWRYAFYIAGIPGILCALAVFLLPEPPRGASEVHNVADRRRDGSPYIVVLSIPTMWWLIASGALHNFNMYAISSFLSPFLMRVHGLDIRQAGYLSMVLNGLSGAPGLLLGGIVGDAISKRRAGGRLIVAAVALLASVPLASLALARPQGDIVGFGLLMGFACALMYVYYSTVYSAIQDVIEPALRSTAMALYFFAMYMLGASLGPVGTGLVSDYLTTRSARVAGATDLTLQALEPFRAEGLRSAMHIIPLLGSLITLVLFAGSLTVGKDMENLQCWMRESSARTPAAEQESAKPQHEYPRASPSNSC